MAKRKARQALGPPVATIADEVRYEFPLRLGQVKLQSELAEGERREYAVQFGKAGRVMGRDGNEVNWEIPPETLREAVPLLNSRPVFIDHPEDDFFGPGTPSIRNAAAITFDPTWNAANESIDGGIRLYNRPDLEWLRILFDEILEDQEAGREVPDFGGSMVLFGRHDWVDVGQEPGEEFLRVTKEINFVESWDIVFRAGLRGFIKEKLSAVGYSPKILSGGKTMKYCKECGTQLQEGECPQCNTIQGTQTQGGTTAASAGNSGGQAAGGAVVPPVQSQPAQGQQQAQGGDGDGQAQAAPPDPQQGLMALNRNMEQLAGIITDNRLQQEAGLVQDLAERFDVLIEQISSQVHPVQGLGHAPNDPHLARITTQRDQLERFQENIDWLFGVDGSTIPDPEYRRADMMYVALTGDVEFQGVFKPERVKLAAANPSTLANMAVDAMNKVIQVQFSALRYWRWYEAVTAVAPNDGSLQDVKWITFGGVGNLPTVADGAAYTELSVDDVRETDSFLKHGAFVGITRKMLKDSEIGRIQAIPRALAAAAIRTRSAAISSIFTDNAGVGPTLDQDSTALFHADHSNVATTAFGTDTTAWAAASLECFNHTEVNSGKKLGVFPRFGLFPADLYVPAKTNFGYGEGMPTSYAPYSVDMGLEDPRPIPLVVPDWTDATDWAYVVDPQVYPVIQMSYSQGPGGGVHPAPELFLVMSETAGLVFTNDTLPIKVRDEFAFGVNGPRGIGKRNVAG